MTETLSIESPQEPQPGSRLPWLALLAVALVIGLGLYFYFSPETEQHPAASGSLPRLSFGPAEQSYAPSVHVENLTLSKNENFLNQEVTTLSGDVANAGGRPLRDVEITIEFFDELHQVVLRETRSLFSSSPAPLAPGELREFEISFEHIPSSWNTEPPAVRVTGLLFSTAKK